MDTHNDNDDSYYGGNANNEAQQNRYAKLQVYQKVTGKSTFKDYEVLTEAFEKKEMLKVFIKGMMFLEEQRTKGKVSLNVEDN